MKYSPLIVAISVAASSMLLTSCDKKQSDQEAAAAAEQPPAIVDIMPVRFQTVPLIEEFSGRTAAYEKSDVRPQVTGTIEQILFKQGSMVEKGQELYRLNLDNYKSSQLTNEAALRQAAANVGTAKANQNSAIAEMNSRAAELDQAKLDLARLATLVDQQAISAQEYDQAQTRVRTAQAAYENAKAAVEQSKANIASAQAAVESAKAQLYGSELDLNRTIVRAPISGMTERTNFTAGALVNANQAEPLVTISKINPIYVDIQQSSADLIRLKQLQSSGKIQQGPSAVQLVLEDGSIYPIQGQLSLREAQVNEDTGSVTLRAIFKNDNEILLPGMYVTARLIEGLRNNAVLLPQSAVIRTPKGETQVYIVDEDNKIQIRPVTIDGTFEGNWVITDGLHANDKVVIKGGSLVKPDQEVETKPYRPSQSNNSSAQSRAPVAPKPQDPQRSEGTQNKQDTKSTATESAE